MMRKADYILKSSRIYKGTGRKLIDGFVAVKGEKIMYAGPFDQMEGFTGPETKVMDFGDKVIMPGIHDAHIHLYMSGLYSSPLVHASFTDTSEQQCVDGLRELAERIPEDRWLIGAGWYHPLWENPVLPSKKSLDAVYPNRPVCMVSGDGHTMWINTKGMEVLGIDRDTQAPPGGTIDKDENGELTGIFHESAASCLSSKVYCFTQEEEDQCYKELISNLNKFGITSVCDVSMMAVPGADFVRDDIYSRLLDKGELNVRVHMYPTMTDEMTRPMEMRDQYRSPMLKCTGVKHFFDGVSSCHTAYLKEPYANAYYEGDCGKLSTNPDDMRRLVLKAVENDLSMRVHTIGDQAIHLMLDYLEEAEMVYGKKPYLQHTLEHLENLQYEDIARLSKLNVVASVQPPHLMIDPNGIERDLGQDRIQLMWPFRRFLDAGVTLAFGTDSPVVEINPFNGLYNAVTRRSAFDGKTDGGWIPAERINVYEAVSAYTYGSACAANSADEIGTLSPGKFADICVLDHNIFEGEPEVILDTKNVFTMVNGRIVYEG